MADMQMFPKTVEEYMEKYKMVDEDHVYSNGIEYVPIFRMKQWFEHISFVHSKLEKNSQKLENKNGELISRQAAIDAFECKNELIVSGEENARNVMNYIVKVIGKIKELPSVQPQTSTITIGRTKGETIMWYECDACGEPVDIKDNYCCNCGRRLLKDG